MKIPSLFGKKEKKPKAPPMPLAGRLINAVAILLFALLVVYQTKKPQESVPAAVTGERARGLLNVRYLEAAEQNAASFLSRIGGREKTAWQELQPGRDPIAICGSMVTVGLKLREADSDDAVPGLGVEVPATRRWRLGMPEQPWDHLTQLLVLDLGTSGVREARMPLSLILALLHPGQTALRDTKRDRLVRLQATLTQADAPPQPDIPLTVLETAPGNTERRAACGDRVALAIQLWRADGSVATIGNAEKLPEGLRATLSETSFALTARLGGGALPYGLERMVEGMGMGASRAGFLPQAWLPTFPETESTPSSYVWPQGETLFVRITRLDPEVLQGTQPDSSKADETAADEGLKNETVEATPSPSSPPEPEPAQP